MFVVVAQFSSFVCVFFFYSCDNVPLFRLTSVSEHIEIKIIIIELHVYAKRAKQGWRSTY